MLTGLYSAGISVTQHIPFYIMAYSFAATYYLVWSAKFAAFIISKFQSMRSFIRFAADNIFNVIPQIVDKFQLLLHEESANSFSFPEKSLE